MFLVEGPRVVAELPGSAISVEAILHQEPAAAAVASLVDRFRGRVACHALSAKDLRSLCGTETPQGIVAVAAIPSWAWADVGEGDLLVLDGVQDPGNVGTLVRAAEAFGIAGIVTLPGTADPWAPKVTRAAAGSTLRLPIIAADWSVAREQLLRTGREVWTAEPHGSEMAWPSTADRPPVALVLGSEGGGISEEVSRDTDRSVAIAVARPVDSLNVGVAGALLMDRLRETRHDG